MRTMSKPALVPARRSKVTGKAAAPAKRSRTKPAPVVAASPLASTKQAQLIALLRSARGTDIQQMIATTGWQPHTVRGTISGVLRKRLGLNVACVAEGDRRVCRIVDAA